MEPLIKDDFFFVPYIMHGEQDGYICRMNLSIGKMTVRYKGRNTFSTADKPYEVRYPDGDVEGYKTANEVWEYISHIDETDDRNK